MWAKPQCSYYIHASCYMALADVVLLLVGYLHTHTYIHTTACASVSLRNLIWRFSETHLCQQYTVQHHCQSRVWFTVSYILYPYLTLRYMRACMHACVCQPVAYTGMSTRHILLFCRCCCCCVELLCIQQFQPDCWPQSGPLSLAHLLALSVCVAVKRPFTPYLPV